LLFLQLKCFLPNSLPLHRFNVICSTKPVTQHSFIVCLVLSFHLFANPNTPTSPPNNIHATYTVLNTTENNYHYPTQKPSPRPNSCRPHQWQCANFECIESRLQCDDFKDCSDGSDEDLSICFGTGNRVKSCNLLRIHIKPTKIYLRLI